VAQVVGVAHGGAAGASRRADQNAVKQH
jgi:hypothetical protein